MNFAYYRKSKYSKEETINKLKSAVSQHGLQVLGETELTQNNGVLLQVCGNDWVDKVLKTDRNLLGLIPCGILVTESNSEVSIGSGNPAILGGVTENTDIQRLAVEAETKIKKIINEASGAGEQKVQNIKLYSTTTCPYCTMEKQWLESNKVKHDVIYVDRNQEEAEKMVRNTGQMGVPVTEVQYEDGESEYIVGFNKAQLSKVIGL
jgi:glutaredoxin/uncharacterized protein (DUF302 family)